MIGTEKKIGLKVPYLIVFYLLCRIKHYNTILVFLLMKKVVIAFQKKFHRTYIWFDYPITFCQIDFPFINFHARQKNETFTIYSSITHSYSDCRES